jgi:hypothetical protein
MTTSDRTGDPIDGWLPGAGEAPESRSAMSRAAPWQYGLLAVVAGSAMAVIVPMAEVILALTLALVAVVLAQRDEPSRDTRAELSQRIAWIAAGLLLPALAVGVVALAAGW